MHFRTFTSKALRFAEDIHLPVLPLPHRTDSAKLSDSMCAIGIQHSVAKSLKAKSAKGGPLDGNCSLPQTEG
jgi:hypothetical protein